MVFDVGVAMTWLLFLALFPITYFWLRRCWRILRHKDLSDVALKGGVSPSNPAKFAPYTVAINLICAGILLTVIGSVVTGRWSYETWSAVAGLTIWSKLLADFILSRHAHPIFKTREKSQAD